jgi:hypothetical protein
MRAHVCLCVCQCACSFRRARAQMCVCTARVPNNTCCSLHTTLYIQTVTCICTCQFKVLTWTSTCVSSINANCADSGGGWSCDGPCGATLALRRSARGTNSGLPGLLAAQCVCGIHFCYKNLCIACVCVLLFTACQGQGMVLCNEK